MNYKTLGIIPKNESKSILRNTMSDICSDVEYLKDDVNSLKQDNVDMQNLINDLDIELNNLRSKFITSSVVFTIIDLIFIFIILKYLK